jgi:hypothetical protein
VRHYELLYKSSYHISLKLVSRVLNTLSRIAIPPVILGSLSLLGIAKIERARSRSRSSGLRNI